MIDTKLIDPFNEENWNFIIPDGTFLTWLKNNYFQEDNWKNITTINCYDQNIENITGVENLINLEKLIFDKNIISNIELKHDEIKYLYINNNQIKEIRKSQLPNLIRFLCNNNYINSFDNLNAPLLVFLEAMNNKMINLTGIKKFTNIVELNLNGNEISCISDIENLKNLKRLSLNRNKISSLKGIEKLNKIIFLDIGHNDITDLSPIKNLNKLEILQCNNNKITKIPFKNLSELKRLEIYDNSLKELDGIENLKKLNTIDCSGNDFTSDYKKYLKEYCNENNIKLFLEKESDLCFTEFYGEVEVTSE